MIFALRTWITSFIIKKQKCNICFCFFCCCEFRGNCRQQIQRELAGRQSGGKRRIFAKKVFRKMVRYVPKDCNKENPRKVLA